MAMRIRPVGREIRSAAYSPELPVRWLLAERPTTEPEPVPFWLSNLPAYTPLASLVRTAKLRWRIEHDYREMKQALSLAHFEGCTWRGWHHHVTLVSVAHAFCTARYCPADRVVPYLSRLLHPTWYTIFVMGSQNGVHNDFRGTAGGAVVQARNIGKVEIHAACEPSPPQHVNMAPTPPTPFIERTDMGKLLVEALLDGRDVVLCGAGGFGKTTLASWAGHQVSERFAGGVLWAELGRKPDDMRIARSLTALTEALTGVPQGMCASARSAASVFRAKLPDQPVLLVVDDVWSKADLEPFVGAGEQVTLLVTTRREGLLDGTRIVVDAMSDAEGAAFPSLGVARAGELRDRVGHAPLALAMLSGILDSLVGRDRHAMTTDEAVNKLATELDELGNITAALDKMSDADVPRRIAKTLELSLLDLVESTPEGENCRDRFVSLAAFPEGEAIPYRLLQRLWGMGEVETRAACDKFISRYLATAVGPDGLRLHDITRQALRGMEPPQRMVHASASLLDVLRPPAGWHALACADGIAYHLRQAERLDELASLLRDMRFLAARVIEAGPTALEADLALLSDARQDDEYVGDLARLLSQEGHLLTEGGLSQNDIALTLESRLVSRPALTKEVRNIAEARPGRGLVAVGPLPDRDSESLLRSFTARESGAYRAIDWHPDGSLLAAAGRGTLEVIDTSGTGWQQLWSQQIPDGTVRDVRWDPDGEQVAVSTGNVLSVHRAADGAETARLSARWSSIAWSPDSASLAVAGVAGVYHWVLESEVPPRQLPGGGSTELQGQTIALDWHDELGLIARIQTSDDEKHEVRLRRWANPCGTRPPEASADLPGRDGQSCWWRPGGSTVTLDMAETALIVDSLTGQVLWRHTGCAPGGVRWGPDGRHLAVQGRDAVLSLWRVPADSELRRGVPPERTTRMELAAPVDRSSGDCIAWRPDGQVIATASRDRAIKLWRPKRTGGETARPISRLTRVRWGPSGRTVRVQTVEGTWLSIDPWNPQAGTGEPVSPPARDLEIAKLRKESPNRLNVVELASDGRTYAVGQSGEPLQVVRANGAPGVDLFLYPPVEWKYWCSIDFTPSGDQVVAVTQDGDGRKTLSHWDLARTTRQQQRHGPPLRRHQQPTAPSTPGTRRPSLGWVRRVNASEKHVAVVADPGIIGLYDLSDIRPICWVRTNAYLSDAAFSPSGEHLAIVGVAGFYLFAVKG
uniref:Transposase n=3 Tax=Streptomyces auratus TaxID=114687 RepID=J1REE5_9ACTN